MNSSEKRWHNFDSFLLDLVKDEEIRLNLSFEHEKNPKIKITINDDIVFNQHLENNEPIEIIHPEDNRQETVIKISMSDKIKRDTVIDQQGNIISDKFARLTTLRVNRFDLLNDPGFLYGDHIHLFDEFGNYKKFVPGFWHNDILQIKYTKPFGLWYNDRTTRNKTDHNEDSQIHMGQLAKDQWANLVENVNKLDH